MKNQKITYTLTDETGDKNFKSMLVFEKNGGRSIENRFPNNDNPSNSDTAVIAYFISRLLSAKFDYGNENVDGVLEGRFCSDYCSVRKAKIRIL